MSGLRLPGTRFLPTPAGWATTKAKQKNFADALAVVHLADQMVEPRLKGDDMLPQHVNGFAEFPDREFGPSEPLL